MPCTTSCGHTFCAKCFLAWYQRMPTRDGAAPTHARCPLCTAEVTRLTPVFERGVRRARAAAAAAAAAFDSDDEAESEAQLRAIAAYNDEVYIARTYGSLRRTLRRLNRACARVVMGAYALSGVVWELARIELCELGGLWRIPPPSDEKARLYAAWVVVTRLCTSTVWPANFAAEPNRLLLDLFQDCILWCSSWNADCRHAELDDEATVRAVVPLRLAHTAAALARLGARHYADALPPWALRRLPAAMRALELAATALDLATLACQLRVELVGLRALLALLEWRHAMPRLERLEPYESNLVQRWVPLELALRRSCRVLCRLGDGALVSRTTSWSAALEAHGAGLKALRVFYGERAYRRAFPAWAVSDVARLPALTRLVRVVRGER